MCVCLRPEFNIQCRMLCAILWQGLTNLALRTHEVGRSWPILPPLLNPPSRQTHVQPAVNQDQEERRKTKIWASKRLPVNVLSRAESDPTPSPGNTLPSQLCNTASLGLHTSSAKPVPPKSPDTRLPAGCSFRGSCMARFLRALAALRLMRVSVAKVAIDACLVWTCRDKPAPVDALAA